MERRAPTTIAAALIAAGEVFFLLLMIVCLAINPSRHAIKIGLSYYGNHMTTIGPFTVGFAVCIVLTAASLAWFRPTTRRGRTLRRGIVAILVLMALVPATPYSIDWAFDYAHYSVCAVLYSVALVLGGWIARVVLRNRLGYCLFALQIGAAVAIVVAELDWVPYMIPAQLTFQAALATLIVCAVARSAPPLATRGFSSVRVEI